MAGLWLILTQQSMGEKKYGISSHFSIFTFLNYLTLYSPGGGGGGLLPLDIFRDKSAARIGLAARFHELFPYRFAHILRPNL